MQDQGAIRRLVLLGGLSRDFGQEVHNLRCRTRQETSYGSIACIVDGLAPMLLWLSVAVYLLWSMLTAGAPRSPRHLL